MLQGSIAISVKELANIATNAKQLEYVLYVMARIMFVKAAREQKNVGNVMETENVKNVAGPEKKHATFVMDWATV